MSIVKLKDGTFQARVQLPTAERDPNGRIIYLDRKKTLASKGAAENWIKQQKSKFRKTGSEKILANREIVEYQEAKEIVGGKDLREVARYFADRNTDLSSTKVEKVVAAYYKSEDWESLAECTRNNQESMFNQFCFAFKDVPIGEVSLKSLNEYLRKYSNSVTRNNHRRVLRRLIAW